MPASARTEFAPMEAPEQKAPTTAITPASISACADVAAVVESQPESAVMSSKL